MENILAQLIELQKTDQEIKQVDAELQGIPKQIASCEEKLGFARANLQRLHSELVRVQTDADAADLEIKSGEEILKKYKKQLGICKSAKEISAVRNQMKTQQAWIDQYVEKGMAFMQQLDEKRAASEAARKEAQGAEAELARMQAEADERSATLRKLLGEARARREQLAAQVPSDELALYNRAVDARGSALAQAGEGTCSACYMRLPPQVHNLVLLKKKLVTCPSCGRILIAG